MSYDYFYGQSGELFSYFRIPKALFQDHRFRQLSTDARTLYGILLDRMSLSYEETVKKWKLRGKVSSFHFLFSANCAILFNGILSKPI